MLCRFGFALTKLGDLNFDGYEDIAVGAPYEGKGAVYIYLGSAQGLIPEPSQVCIMLSLRHFHEMNLIHKVFHSYLLIHPSYPKVL